jgi:peptidoglycan/LPS O-acetylase OafA/YrhL
MDASAMNTNRADLRPLTSLRFVAAMMVFVYHLSPFGRWPYAFGTGDAGVGFFFVLSGFILAYTYQNLMVVGSADRIRAFYIARFARIYPTHFVATIIACIVLAVVGSSDPIVNVPGTQLPALLTQLTLVQSWVPLDPIHYGMNGPSWSISDETFFYALLPLVLPLVASIPRTRYLIMLGVGLWVVVTAIAWVLPGTLDDWIHYVCPVSRIPDFVIGVVAGVVFVRRNDRCGTLWELVAIELVLVSLVVHAVAPVAFHPASVMLPGWTVLIYVMAHQRGVVSRWLSHPFAVYLGRVSFSFYLIHLTVIRLIPERLLSWSIPVAFALALAVSVIIASIMNTYFEEPVRRVIRNAFEPRISPLHTLQPTPE